MKILGIETSCDETAAAVVEDLPAQAGGKKVLSETIASSAKLHIKTGGIIPENAAREQIKFIIPVLKKTLKNIEVDKIDAIAVTVGPGLIGSLLVGVETAKTLSYLWDVPIIPVNHLVGHIYANWINNAPEFPALCLVVSGGHTDLVLIKDHPSASSGQVIKWIGGTVDDAAGECFDKTARLLDLPYPGGPEISKHASSFYLKNKNIKPASPAGGLNMFPRPMIHQKNFDFSFSGLKTSVLNYTKQNTDSLASLQNDNMVSMLSAEIQEAIVDVLVTKSMRAITKFKPKSFLLAGGVSANTRLREEFKLRINNNFSNTKLYIPEIKHCTDNAVMIATAAFYKDSVIASSAYNKKCVDWKKVSANPELSLVNT